MNFTTYLTTLAFAGAMTLIEARPEAFVVAEPMSAYQSYVANLAQPLVLGGQEWRSGCATCHGIAGKGGYGPAIATNQTLVQTQTLERLVRNGQNILKPLANYMPPVARGWNEFQVKALEAYLKQSIYKGPVSGR